MPAIITLPSRQGSIEYTDEQVADVAQLLDDAGVGQGVAIDDTPQDTEPKARNRAKIMRDLLKRDHDLDTRTHVVNTGDDKNPAFFPVLALKKS